MADGPGDVIHSRVAARKRTAAARPAAVADRIRGEGYSRAVDKRVAGAVADRSREVGHSRMVARRRTVAAHSLGVADRTEGMGHSRVRTVVGHSRAVAE